jgi:HK97 family phage major capsid protein
MLERRLDGIEVKSVRPGATAGDSGPNGVKALIRAFEASRDVFLKSGRVILETGSLLSRAPELKAVTSAGIVPYGALPGIDPGARKTFRLRSFLASEPINAGSVAFIRETDGTSITASPQVEGASKSESTLEFEMIERGVKTIATWTAVTKQVLDDLVELEQHVNQSLVYGLEEEVENQLLSGSGVGENLEGLTTVADSFDPTLLSLLTGGYTFIDVLRLAALQLEEAGFACGGFVLSPRDWTLIELTKDEQGRYVVPGGPGGTGPTMLWNRPVCVTAGMTAGRFLAGDFSRAHIRQRQTATVDFSTEHSDFFVRNQVAIRAEERLCLVIKRPEAFLYGSLTTSPA